MYIHGKSDVSAQCVSIKTSSFCFERENWYRLEAEGILQKDSYSECDSLVVPVDSTCR